MRPPAGRAPLRPGGRSIRTILLALAALGVALLVVVIATRPKAIPSVGVGGPTNAPSLSPRPSAAGPGPTASTAGPSPSKATPPAGSGFDPANVGVRLEPFVTGLSAPLAIVNAGDGTGRLFVAEQGGAIRIVRDGSLVDRPFLDIGSEITSGGERGLLGVAFHPRYPEDPRVFVDYTDGQGDTQVSSFTVDPADADRVDPGSETRLLHVDQPFANHNGGALLFDAGGMLLISLGDGGSGGDPQGNGQSLTTLLGKVLRIDVDGGGGRVAGRPYGIPADNPYADGAAGSRPEIWLSGLRNPWRMSLDRANGDLWIGDVGQNAWEEIDVQRAAEPGGTNFGWNRMEGTHCFEPSDGCESPSLVLPVTDYGHDLGCTVIGGNVYRGEAQAALAGGYLFADYCSGHLFAIDPAGDTYRPPVDVGKASGNIGAFGEDEDGELYAANLGGGTILRVIGGAR